MMTLGADWPVFFSYKTEPSDYLLDWGCCAELEQDIHSQQCLFAV